MVLEDLVIRYRLGGVGRGVLTILDFGVVSARFGTVCGE